jgi:hypothetical protein
MWTDRRTVAKYAGPTLEKRGSHWRIKPYDRIQRRQLDDDHRR